jgi:hypothetical protein
VTTALAAGVFVGSAGVAAAVVNPEGVRALWERTPFGHSDSPATTDTGRTTALLRSAEDGIHAARAAGGVTPAGRRDITGTLDEAAALLRRTPDAGLGADLAGLRRDLAGLPTLAGAPATDGTPAPGESPDPNRPALRDPAARTPGDDPGAGPTATPAVGGGTPAVDGTDPAETDDPDSDAADDSGDSGDSGDDAAADDSGDSAKDRADDDAPAPRPTRTPEPVESDDG